MVVVAIITCIFVYGWKDVLMYISKVADNARGRSHILDDLLFFGIIVVVGICGLPGMTMIELTCGFVLGFLESFILSTIAITAVSLAAFGIGRYLFRDILKTYLEEDSDTTTFKNVLKSIERRNGIGLLVLFRLMFVPLFIKNYAPAVINTKFSDFSIAVLITTPFYVSILTFMGSHAKTIADIATGKVAGPESSFGWVEIAPIAISIVAGLGFTTLAYFEFRKLTQENSSSQPDEQVSLMNAAQSI